LNRRHIGEEVRLCGWVHRRRDHGGLIFVDLRDREGLVQVVFDPDRPEMFRLAEQIRSEYVLQVRGRVRPRPEGTENRDLATGEVEVLALALEVLNASDTPPSSSTSTAGMCPRRCACDTVTSTCADRRCRSACASARG